MDFVLEHAKVSITIQYHAKSQSYAKAKGSPSYHKGTRRAWRHAAATTSTNPEEVPGLKANNDGTFKVYGKFYPLKVFVPEDIYIGKLPKEFWDTRRYKMMAGPRLPSTAPSTKTLLDQVTGTETGHDVVLFR